MKPFKIKLDYKQDCYEEIQVSMLDTVLLECEVTDNWEAMDLTGATIQMQIGKPDGKFTVQTSGITVSKNIVSITLDQQATVVPSKEKTTELTLVITKTGMKKGLWIIKLKVKPTAISEKVESASSIPLIKELTDKVTEGNTLKGALITEIGKGNTLKTDLTNKITEGNTLKTDLTNKVNEGNTLKTALAGQITTGTTLKNDLSGQITTGTTLKNDLTTKITEANKVKTDTDNLITNGGAIPKTNGEGYQLKVGSIQNKFLITGSNTSGEYTEIAPVLADGTAHWIRSLRYYYGDGSWAIGNLTQRIYHQGFRPTPAEIGAMPENAGGLNYYCITPTGNDWNNANKNGWYMTNMGANKPSTGTWHYGIVIAHNDKYITQQVYDFTGSFKWYERHKKDGTWTSWVEMHTASYVGAVSTVGDSSITGNLTVNENLKVNKYLKLKAWDGYGTGEANLWYDNANDTGVLLSAEAKQLKLGGKWVYHEGRKPTPADIGASATSHNHDATYIKSGGKWSTSAQDLLVHNKRALVGTPTGELHLGFGGDFTNILCGNSNKIYHDGWCGEINSTAKKVSNINPFMASGWYSFTAGCSGAPCTFGNLLHIAWSEWKGAAENASDFTQLVLDLGNLNIYRRNWTNGAWQGWRTI